MQGLPIFRGSREQPLNLGAHWMLPAGPCVLPFTGSHRLSASEEATWRRRQRKSNITARPARSTPSTQRGNGWPGFQAWLLSQSGLASAGAGARSQNCTRIRADTCSPRSFPIPAPRPQPRSLLRLVLRCPVALIPRHRDES